MKLNSEWLHNFRTYKGDYKIDFTEEPLNLITADNNGAGKTTLFLAFYYLIIGFTAGKTQNDYINWDCDDMSCGVDLTYMNLRFIIESSLKRGKTPEKTLSIFTNGVEEKFEGVTSVNKKLKEFFDPSLFLNSTALFQGSKNFTSIKDSERRDNLKKVFDIDYKDDIKGLEIRIKDSSKKLNDIEKSLAILKSKKFELDTLKKFEVVTDDNIEDFNKEVIDLKSKINNIAIKLAVMDKNKKEYENLKNEIAILNTSIESNEKKICSINSDIITINTFEYKTNVDFLKEQLYSLKVSRVKAFDKELLSTKQSSLASSKTVINLDNKKLKDCEAGICPVCGKKFTSSDTESIKKDIEANTSLIKSLEKDIDILKKQEIEINAKIDKNNEINKEKSILTEKIDSEEKRVKREKEVNAEKLAQLNEQLLNIQTIIKTSRESLSTKQKVFDSIVIEDVSELVEENKNLEISLQDTELKIKKYEEIKTSNTIIKESNDKKKKEEIENSKEIEFTQKEYNEEILKGEQFSKMRIFLKNEFPSYVISAMSKQIQDSMNEFISSVYYKDLNVEINATDDNISVLYGSGSVKVDTINASGAEESLLALSYCSALNELKHYDILFIDEVDQAFTEDNSQKLAEIIVESKSKYDTIFAISHVKNTKDFYSMKGANVIYVNNRI
jgi:DNA repair exonuclease SbcCD ATPase subunit